jgi:hypothetical protein
MPATTFTIYATTTLVRSTTTARDHLVSRAAGVGLLEEDHPSGTKQITNETLTVDLSDLPNATAQLVYIETDSEVIVRLNGDPTGIAVRNHLCLVDVDVTELTIQEASSGIATVRFFVAGK